MVLADYVVLKARTRIGDKYVFGAEADGNPDPKTLDCSELVQWVCQQLKVTPPMVDGARFQLDHCAKWNTLITLDEAKRTAGTLVFRRNKDTHTVEHVAFSNGPTGTIEARGKDYNKNADGGGGVGTWPWGNRTWTDAAKIPGVVYP